MDNYGQKGEKYHLEETIINNMKDNNKDRGVKVRVLRCNEMEEFYNIPKVWNKKYK
ncbi:Hypothetical protein ORPV_1175 [Orpheovirus IHUMI-LCC2]|uniref:Uncharacterized protein n=1 Tax=Orpheovirus IHUMI-LCC2 TaxID=2023057 RepID=A0A2I2L6H9_9VIRU|nr:Hypothetical protein ORPV_1175 [Orpheovirus IHUMI-LCC2]SNW63079.1 Hypothetical protein ORPV_1175 [Orpheovirus IHUMI-LCC2]